MSTELPPASTPSDGASVASPAPDDVEALGLWEVTKAGRGAAVARGDTAEIRVVGSALTLLSREGAALGEWPLGRVLVTPLKPAEASLYANGRFVGRFRSTENRSALDLRNLVAARTPAVASGGSGCAIALLIVVLLGIGLLLLGNWYVGCWAGHC